MPKLGEAFVNIRANLKPLHTGLAAAKAAVKTAMRGISSVIKHAFNLIKKLTLIAVGITTVSVYKAMQQEKATVKLAAALKMVGQYSDATYKDLKNYAAALQKITTYGDETIIALMQLGLNLGVSADNIKEATKLTIGLAAGLDLDVKAMMKYVALAMQGEFTMLRRYIPALRNTEDELEQMKILQDAANKGFGVEMEYAAKTASGALRQIKNMLGDVAEKFGQVFLPAFIKIRDYINENINEMNMWAEIIGEYVKFIIIVMKEFVKFMKEDWVGGLKFALNAFLKLLKTAFITAIKMSIAAGKAMYRGLREGFLGKPFSERKIEHMIGKIYEEKLAAAKPEELVLPPKMGMIPTPGAYGEYRREALERLEAQTLKDIIGDTFESMKEDWKKTLDEIAEATPSKLTEPVKKAWEDLQKIRAEIEERYKNKMIEGIEDAIGKTLDLTKEITKPKEKKFGFAGIREAWERMVSGMSPELKESKKQTEKLTDIEIVFNKGFNGMIRAIETSNAGTVGA